MIGFRYEWRLEGVLLIETNEVTLVIDFPIYIKDIKQCYDGDTFASSSNNFVVNREYSAFVLVSY